MIEAYDKQTGDGNWLRQSIQIFQESIRNAQRIESQVDGGDRRANVTRDVTASNQKDLQGCPTS